MIARALPAGLSGSLSFVVALEFSPSGIGAAQLSELMNLLTIGKGRSP